MPVLVLALMVGAALAGCSTSDDVSVLGTGVTGGAAAGPDDSAPAATQPVTTPALGEQTTTTIAHTGSEQQADCVQPFQFRDSDSDGFGVCFRPDGASDPPDGPNIVLIPGSTGIVLPAANITVDIEVCEGDPTAGTLQIVGELVNFGDAIDRGSIDLHVVDDDGTMATLVARVTAVGQGTHAALDFRSPSDALLVGHVQACWFDSVDDVMLFTLI